MKEHNTFIKSVIIDVQFLILSLYIAQMLPLLFLSYGFTLK